jgi:plastocyanin
MKKNYLFHLLTVLLLLVSSEIFAATQVVNVSNFVFSPSSFTINLGDTVKWVWIQGTHTTTSSAVPGGAASWDSDIKSSVPSFTYVPAASGSYSYFCTPHESFGMMGSFTVNCPVPSVTIAAGGPTSFCKPGSVLLSSTGVFSAYQWNRNGSPLAGATNSTLSATTSGDYTLTVTNGCGNMSTSNSISVAANSKPGVNFTQGPCSGGAVLLTRTGNPTTGVTFKWKKDNVNIAGATNSTFSATMTGSYRVEVTISATGCKKTSQPQTVTINCKEGIPEMKPVVSAYPNPSSGSFVFSTALLAQAGTVEIYDLAGKLIESLPFFNTDAKSADDLKEGIYLAKIIVGGTEIKMIKLIKNK